MLGSCLPAWLLSRPSSLAQRRFADRRRPVETPHISRDPRQSMNAQTSTRLPALPAPPLREYYARVLAYIAIAASIAAGTFVQHFGYDILWMVPYALLYPHLAHQLSLLFIDALHAGAAMALLGFSVVPSLMALLILSFSSLVIGGLRYMALGILVALSSSVLNAALIGPQIEVETPAVVALVSILFTILYICITAYFVHQQGLRLAQVRSEIKREQEKAMLVHEV